MTEHKQNQLLAAARQAPVPVLPSDWAEGVVRAVRQESIRRPAPRTLWEELNVRFTRLALGSLALLALGLAANLALSPDPANDWDDGPGSSAAQWWVLPDAF